VISVCTCTLPVFALPLLAANNLTGTLPPELGLLDELVELEVFDNQIQGNLPQEMILLTRLTNLAIQGNSLNGPIPEWINHMQSLTVLAMGSNNFIGTLPSSFAQLSLTELFLNDNKLSGDIGTLRSISTLKMMYLQNNEFTGKLDDFFHGSINEFEEIDLSNNELSGTIPPGLLNMRILDLHDNMISGSFPQVDSDLFDIEFLALHNNRLEGHLSSELSRLQKLTHLDLSLNNFQGPMPELKRMTQLSYLFLAKNKFDEGPVPEDWSNLVNLKELSLKDTGRTGTIPSFLGSSVRHLTQLDLAENKFGGELAPEIGNLWNCSFMLLNNNQLTGYIPRSLVKLSNLREFPIRCSWDVFC
jgi:Leucine-rich repeat (LRR) protein